MIAMIVSVFGLTSCSLETSTAPEVTPSTTQSDDSSPDKPNINKPGQGRAYIDDWTDAGTIHNSCLDVLDDSLAIRTPESFSNQEAAIEWTINMLSDHLINELDYDSTYINPVRRYWLDEGNHVSTRSEFQATTDDLEDDNIITAREAIYLYRLSNILYNPTWTESQRSDSLTSFKNDVNGISWYAFEETIEPLMSIAFYSWDWRLTGFDDSDPQEQFDIDWGIVFDSDVTGGQIGALTGCVVPLLAGAAVASGVAVICCIILN